MNVTGLLRMDRVSEAEAGIYVDRLCMPAPGQEDEHRLRDAVATPYLESREAAIREATHHHSRAVMLQRASHAVRSAVTASAEPVVVDLGCGFGWHWVALAAAHPGVRFVLVDFSLVNLRVARNLMPYDEYPNVVCVQASILDMPFADAVAHLAWSVQVMQHLQPQEVTLALEEMKRILAPGGAYYIAWVRPVPAIKVLRKLLGRGYHVSGRTPYGLYLDRFTSPVRDRVLASLPEARIALSECLFHPELRVRAGAFGSLDLLISRSPVGPLLARQAEVTGVV
jgi:SAM-dependent methyltransferase